MTARSVVGRIAALEKVLGRRGERLEFSLLQTIVASMGKDPGPPAQVLRAGEPSVETLINEIIEGSQGLSIYAPLGATP